MLSGSNYCDPSLFREISTAGHPTLISVLVVAQMCNYILEFYFLFLHMITDLHQKTSLLLMEADMMECCNPFGNFFKFV